MKNSISGIILAGGDNNRFKGITKSNIVIEGKTIISRIIDTISDVFGEIIIVTNTPEEFNMHNNCRIVTDLFLKTGPLGGVHAAIKASSKEAVFVFAGDMPFLEKDLIISQIDRFLEEKCEVLVPMVNNYPEPLHSIYNNSILNKLEKYLTENREYAVRDFLKEINVHYMQIYGSGRNIRSFTNINSASDLKGSQNFLNINIGDNTYSGC